MKPIRRKRVLLAAALATLAVAVLAAGWHFALTAEDGEANWVSDLAGIRGPHDAWDFVTGTMAKRRRYEQMIEAEVMRELHWIRVQEELRNADWPMFGGTPQRNMANPTAKNIPADWCVKTGKLRNIKWTAELGTQSYSGPVVADGKVFVGTNNANPRDAAVKGLKAVLMCFAEADGKFLWQAVHEVPASNLQKKRMISIWGLWSTPCIVGKRHYYVTPACRIICADNDTGKVVWDFDFMKQLKVVPMYLGNCSPLVVDDLVMVVTGNGADEDGKVASPDAPSFVALHKDTGKLVWQSSLPGKNIIEGQWSNPAVAVIDGKTQVIFPGGDCWLYSFEPTTGKLIWKCNCNPLRDDPNKREDFNPYFVGTPVVHEGRCYIGLGVLPADHAMPPRYSYLLCLNIAGKGDRSPMNLNAGDPVNQGSALVWSYGGPIEPPPKKGRRAHFGRTASTCAIHGGLLYIAEESGYLHCLDAQTGQRHAQADVRAVVCGSAFYADAKVFLGTDDGEVIIYQHGKNLKELARVDMGHSVQSTPTVANGVLYIAASSKLYAIAAEN